MIFFRNVGEIVKRIDAPFFLLETEIVEWIEAQRGTDEFKAERVDAVFALHEKTESRVAENAKGGNDRDFFVQESTYELFVCGICFFRVFGHQSVRVVDIVRI